MKFKFFRKLKKLLESKAGGRDSQRATKKVMSSSNGSTAQCEENEANDYLQWNPLSKSLLFSGVLTRRVGLDLSLHGAGNSLKVCHQRWVELLTKNPDMKLAIIGGGIYGCHFAHVFDMACKQVSAINEEGLINAKVVIFDKDNALFSQASGKNSYRIHRGFHYPRSGQTRRRCYYDHNRFKVLYPQFFRTAHEIKDIPAYPKIFIVAKNDETKLDYDAMRHLFIGANFEEGQTMWEEIDGELWSEDIRQSSNLDVMRKQMEEYGFDTDLIDGAFMVQVEPVLYADKPRTWFTKEFNNSPFVELKLSKRVDHEDVKGDHEDKMIVHGEAFDLALNCTYNQAIPIQLEEHKAFYDLCISVIVAEKLHGGNPVVSFGIFDGPFPSLEPYDFSDKKNLPPEIQKYKDQNLFQIFDVKLSSVARVCDAHAAYKMMESWEEKKRTGSNDYKELVRDIWIKCEKYFPRLGTDFELVGTWFALKTKVEDENAARPLIVLPDETVDRRGRFIQVFSSKLTSIFEAEEEVLNLIE